jgi:fucose permease
VIQQPSTTATTSQDTCCVVVASFHSAGGSNWMHGFVSDSSYGAWTTIVAGVSCFIYVLSFGFLEWRDRRDNRRVGLQRCYGEKSISAVYYVQKICAMATS